MNIMQIIILFAVLQLVNVVLSTIKSIITVKGTTFQSALMNTIYYSLYTVIVIFTVADFGLGETWNLVVKICIVAITDFIGVYISAFILAKLKKDKLWEIVATISHPYDQFYVEHLLNAHKISYNSMLTTSNDLVLHIYSKTQTESANIKRILTDVHAKYVVHEESVKL